MRLATAACATAVLAACLSASPVFAQPLPSPPGPGPYGAAETRGQVVDSEGGTPVQGAVVVLRWEWLRYYPGGFHSSAGFQDEGDVLHVAEAVTDANGRYAVAGWGPIVKASGKMEPRVLVFKSGYSPARLAFGERDETVARLAKASAAPKDYARALAAFQRDGLKWLDTRDGWKQTPRMILALHREKARLGEDGVRVLGAYLLHGRSGRGDLALPGYAERVRRASFDGSRVSPPIVAIRWTLRSDDARSSRRLVQQKSVTIASLSPPDSSSFFYVSPWRHLQADPPGWHVALDEAPLVRIYAAGYGDLADMPWTEAGRALALQPLPKTREAALGQLRRWRSDIDAELAKGDPDEALAGQQLLIWLLAHECAQLTLDARQGICFDPASKIARSAQKLRVLEPHVLDAEEGRDMLQEDANFPQAGSAIQGISASMPRNPGPKKPVDGFVIKPVEPAPREKSQ